ncbi:MAG: hypothetical protein NC397_00545 [Clostridium sp.]|nr:hypothetical protein [Clostridium sp.]
MCERKAIKEDELDIVFAKAADLVIQKKKLKGVPVSRYDIKTKRAYLEYPDGRIVYAKA